VNIAPVEEVLPVPADVLQPAEPVPTDPQLADPDPQPPDVPQDIQE
jgi:hypothetical protein